MGNTRVVIPSDGVTKKAQINHLISHLAKSDNHLWQALNSLQNQSNSLVNDTTDWTSWTPSPTCFIGNNPDGSPKDPVPFVEVKDLTAYYVVYRKVLYIELWTNQVILPAGTEKIFIDLPVDSGPTAVKTCAAWLVCPPILTQGNGICSVECLNQTATLVVNPDFVGPICRFMMGGALGIIQTPGQLEGVNTPPPR